MPSGADGGACLAAAAAAMARGAPIERARARENASNTLRRGQDGFG